MKKLNKKFVIVLLSVTVLVLVLMTVAYKIDNTPIASFAGSVIAPVQKGAAVALSGTKNLVKDVCNSRKNAAENKKMKKTVSELEKQLRMVDGYKAENEKLHELLKLRDTREEMKTVAANIIGRDMGEINYTITIDKGTKHGVKKDSVVIVPEGLVGVVYEASYNYSKVKTLLDAQSSISAVCARNGDMGIAEGSTALAPDGKCVMNYIDKGAKTVVGDLVETSGTGGIYPRGILIGKITEIKDDERRLNLCAIIETSVNLRNIDTVLVSTK